MKMTAKKSATKPMSYKSGGAVFKPCAKCPNPGKCKSAGKCMAAKK